MARPDDRQGVCARRHDRRHRHRVRRRHESRRPRPVANLAASLANQNESGERDVKVYQDHAYVVAGSFGHGMQVFDLTRLRDAIIPETFQSDILYTDLGEAKNIAINEETGFAYVALTFGGGCNRGLHIVDITTPNNPIFAGCHSPGVVLDAQCVVYQGPDTEHVGREICLSAGPNAFHIGDVTDKTSTVTLSSTSPTEVEQFNNGSLTEDHRYYVSSDYQDEAVRRLPTRTHVLDVSDLDAPVYLYSYQAATMARDHNLFIRGNLVFQANYAAGLRVLEMGDLAAGELTEVAFFDTAPLEASTRAGAGASRRVSVLTVRPAPSSSTTSTGCSSSRCRGYRARVLSRTALAAWTPSLNNATAARTSCAISRTRVVDRSISPYP